MVVRVTHSKVSGKPQGSDPARVYGNHWDEDHVVEGLDIGTDVQAHDDDLDAIAALTPSDDDIIQRKGGTWANRSPAQYIADLGALGTTFQPLDSDLTAIAALSTTSYGRGLLTLANAAALAAEVDPYFLTPAEGNAAYQPLDSDLTAIAALSTTSYGRAFLALADAAAARTAVGLGNVDNTSDANKPVSTATQTALNLKANLASPTFTGTPAAPTPSFNDNTTKIGTTAFFFNQVSNATPLGAAAVAAAGTSTLWARADHVHPGREAITGNRTYYVRPDGSNSNTGLVNNLGGAFLTIQKAVDVVVGTLDLQGFSVTIQVADGTYTDPVIFSGPWTGGGTVIIQGNSGAPGNVIISTTSTGCFTNNGVLPGVLTIKDMELRTTTSGSGINNAGTGYIGFQNINFGACATAHIITNAKGSKIQANGNYTINGGSGYHMLSLRGEIDISARTVTLTGTPAFSAAFAFASRLGYIGAEANTFSGSATGTRYSVSSNAVIYTGGGGATYLPGNAPGVGTNSGTTPFGLYV